MRRQLSSWGILALVVFLFGCDHGTKYLATTHLRGESPIELIRGVMQLQYTENRDVAFSLLRHVPSAVRTPLIFVFGAAGLGLIAVLWRRRRDARIVERVGLALILAGALGNLTDRLIHGYVVDFVYVRHWPVFNAADTWLVVGVALLLLLNWNSRPAEAPVPQPIQPAPPRPQ